MARYFQRRLALEEFVPFSFAAIAGLNVTALFDDGELLISPTLHILNQDGVNADRFAAHVRIDAETAPTQNPRIPMPASGQQTIAFTVLRRLAAGVHTIEVLTIAELATGDLRILPNSILTVVQLPLWSPADEIEEPA